MWKALTVLLALTLMSQEPVWAKEIPDKVVKEPISCWSEAHKHEICEQVIVEKQSIALTSELGKYFKGHQYTITNTSPDTTLKLEQLQRTQDSASVIKAVEQRRTRFPQVLSEYQGLGELVAWPYGLVCLGSTYDPTCEGGFDYLWNGYYTLKQKIGLIMFKGGKGLILSPLTILTVGVGTPIVTGRVIYYGIKKPYHVIIDKKSNKTIQLESQNFTPEAAALSDMENLKPGDSVSINILTVKEVREIGFKFKIAETGQTLVITH